MFLKIENTFVSITLNEINFFGVRPVIECALSYTKNVQVCKGQGTTMSALKKLHKVSNNLSQV